LERDLGERRIGNSKEERQSYFPYGEDERLSRGGKGKVRGKIDSIKGVRRVKGKGNPSHTFFKASSNQNKHVLDKKLESLPRGEEKKRRKRMSSS